MTNNTQKFQISKLSIEPVFLWGFLFDLILYFFDPNFKIHLQPFNFCFVQSSYMLDGSLFRSPHQPGHLYQVHHHPLAQDFVHQGCVQTTGIILSGSFFSLKVFFLFFRFTDLYHLKRTLVQEKPSKTNIGFHQISQNDAHLSCKQYILFF